MSIFEKMVEFDIFYRDRKKCFSPLKKKKLNVQQDNLALLRRKHGVVHEEESENELEN